MKFVEWSSSKFEQGARGLFSNPVLLIGSMLVVAVVKFLFSAPGGLED